MLGNSSSKGSTHYYSESATMCYHQHACPSHISCSCHNTIRKFWRHHGYFVNKQLYLTSTSTATQVVSSTNTSSQFTFSTTCINPLEIEEDQKINVIIIFSAIVADHLIPTVHTFKDDPVELWLNLKQQFQSGALERQLALKNQLHYMRMKEG